MVVAGAAMVIRPAAQGGRGALSRLCPGSRKRRRNLRAPPLLIMLDHSDEQPEVVERLLALELLPSRAEPLQLRRLRPKRLRTEQPYRYRYRWLFSISGHNPPSPKVVERELQQSRQLEANTRRDLCRADLLQERAYRSGRRDFAFGDRYLEARYSFHAAFARRAARDRGRADFERRARRRRACHRIGATRRVRSRRVGVGHNST